MTQRLDVCIRGGGIVGHTLALLLARDRLRIGLVAPDPPADAAPDVRVYAINAKSRDVLASVRCWPEADLATAVRAIQVVGDDGGEVNFDAQALSVDALTWIVDVPALEAMLREAVRYQPHVVRLDAPQPATLTVVCEGRHSTTRDELGVVFDAVPYPQHAIAARLRCEKPHGQVARQWFNGPNILALLPMDGAAGQRVGLVWSAPSGQTPELLALDEAAFCARVAELSENSLGVLTLDSPRKAWPLQSAQARQWTGVHQGQSWVLAGDAAHNIHPLAGQGLNLGLGDAAQLAQLIHDRTYWRPIDDPRLLRRYERARRTEVTAVDWAMTGLQQLFSRPGAPWQRLRNWGMQAFDFSGSVKHWAARLARGM